MFRRIVLAGFVGVMLVGGAWSGARAQQPSSLPPGTSQSGWVFNVAPYLWLPSVHATLDYNLPAALGGRVPTSMDTGPGDYLSNMNFSAMFAAEADYGPFSFLTDFVYGSFTSTAATFKSVDFAGRPIQPISKSVQLSTATNFKTTLLTLAPGYTVAQGAWGSFTVFAGAQGLQVNTRTNYDVALTLTGPRGNSATFGGVGYLGAIKNVWNGIAGFRGRVLLGNNGFFIPYYFDIGAGGSQLTWQIASGLGYQTGWAGVSLTYRYLSFEQDNRYVVQHLGMGGPMLMVNFTF